MALRKDARELRTYNYHEEHIPHLWTEIEWLRQELKRKDTLIDSLKGRLREQTAPANDSASVVAFSPAPQSPV